MATVRQSTPGEVRVALQVPLPIAVADERNGSRTFSLFFGVKGPAEEGLDAHDPEEVPRNLGRQDTSGLLPPGDGDEHGLELRQPFEAPVLLRQVGEVRIRHLGWPVTVLPDFE